MKKLKTSLIKMLDRFVASLPQPLFMLYVWLAMLVNPKMRDLCLFSCGMESEDGKTLITRPDGHIVMDDNDIRQL